MKNGRIETVEGLESANGDLHPVQQAFVEELSPQCGYCTPGMLMSAKALNESEDDLDPQKISEALSGNLCRCTGYAKIIEAVEKASMEHQSTTETSHG